MTRRYPLLAPKNDLTAGNFSGRLETDSQKLRLESSKMPEISTDTDLTAGDVGVNNKFWPPRVVWNRETGYLSVRDPWGDWHVIPAKQAPSGYVRIANQNRRNGF